MPTPTALPPARRRSRAPLIVLLALVAAAVAFAFRQGIVPLLLNPLPTVDLGQASAWFVDWRLAALKYQPDLCRQVLIAPHIDAKAIPDSPVKDGCGWNNAVRMTTAGGARIGFDKLTCEAAAALAMWVAHEVQPLAKEMFGQPVTALQSYGSYSCRNIIGNSFWKDRRSEHATANAADIGGFTLADGRQISVLRDWQGDKPEARFLRAVHKRACRYFHVVLGPDFNPAHRDHFHLDRGLLWRCT
jgi:hypothetical protein